MFGMCNLIAHPIAYISDNLLVIEKYVLAYTVQTGKWSLQ